MSVRARLFTVLAVLVVALLGADYVAWRVVTDRLLDGFAGWQASLAASGWSVTSDPPARAGWPLAARVRLDEARLGQVASSGFAWSAAQVTFGVGLLHPHELSVRPDGAQSFSLPGRPDIQWQAARLEAVAPLGAPIRSVHVEARGLAVATPQGAAVAETAALDIGWAPDAAHLSLAVGPVSLPPAHHWGLGRSTTVAALDLVAHGAWPPGAPTTAAAQWRDAGGQVDVSRLALQWGTLDLAGSGQVALDATLQPDATLSLKIADPQAAVSMLADAGAISEGRATAAEAILSLLAMPARLAGQPVVLTLPAHITAGTMTIGAIPIARIPIIAWPGS